MIASIGLDNAHYPYRYKFAFSSGSAAPPPRIAWGAVEIDPGEADAFFAFDPLGFLRLRFFNSLFKGPWPARCEHEQKNGAE